MIGVVGGLLAALLWGTSGVAAARSSRMVGAEVALAWVYMTGLAVSLPVALFSGLPHADDGALAWTALAASMAVVSLYLMYAALRRGPIALVMPITASQGGLAALVAVGLGEHLRAIAGIGLAVVMLGLYAIMRRPARREGATPHPTAAVALAALCAVLSALALYGAARSAQSLGTAWLLATLRTAGVLGLTVPLALSGRLRRPGPALPLVVFSGLADTGAFASYVIGASHGGVAVPAVISSQFAAVSALIGVVAMGERLTRVQVCGGVAILGGVALVTAVQT